MATYLALTAGELSTVAPDKEKIAYMACHFSPYSAGLSNIPTSLPPGSMLILNDRIPICGHDPSRITDQLESILESLKCDSLLLDFERPGSEETARLCQFLTQHLACPLGISHHYAKGLDCCAFLPPVPLNIPIEEYLHPWKGKRIWLEAALETAEFTVTADGCQVTSLPYEPPQSETFPEKSLHCRYRCEVNANQIRFHLYRTRDQLDALLEKANSLGVEKAIGLYQQLNKRKPLVH